MDFDHSRDEIFPRSALVPDDINIGNFDNVKKCSLILFNKLLRGVIFKIQPLKEPVNF